MLHLDEIRDHFQQMTAVIDTRKNLPLHTSLHYHVEEFIHDVVESYRSFKSLDDYDAIKGASYKPWKLIREFLDLRSADGMDRNLSKQERVRLNELYNIIRAAAIERADIVLTTNNFSGSRLARYFPSIFCLQDEAAQTNVASSIIPLVAHPDIDGYVLFGDEEQLEPTVLIHEMNELSFLAELLLFRLLLQKGADMEALDTQYRFLADIASFVSGEYYEGKLKTAGARMQRDANAFKVMAVSKKEPYKRPG